MEMQRRKAGTKLTKAERDQLLVDLVDLLHTGYINDYQLSLKLNVNVRTVQKLRPVADKLIALDIPDRNIIRNLSIKRAYRMIERLAMKFDGDISLKDELSIHDKIVKYSQHLALITGLNVETKINVDQKKLVIIRAHPKAVSEAIDGEAVKTRDKTNMELVDEIPE